VSRKNIPRIVSETDLAILQFKVLPQNARRETRLVDDDDNVGGQEGKDDYVEGQTH
jgi:hypothetical protein